MLLHVAFVFLCVLPVDASCDLGQYCLLVHFSRRLPTLLADRRPRPGDGRNGECFRSKVLCPATVCEQFATIGRITVITVGRLSDATW